LHLPTTLKKAMTRGNDLRHTTGYLLKRNLRLSVLVLLALFTIYYFGDILLRASEKYFWYDELVTVYLCRLPTLGDIHQAVIHATDFNPPLFYVVTRISQSLFGEGLITTRLPEILGFWLLCLSLFAFVYRKAGLLAGFIAMTLPMLSEAYYYAYEARPHGIVLGCCGLALLCWQLYLDNSRKTWLALFSLCLLAAFMNHCYALVSAVPFGLAELVRSWRRKQIDWKMWAALTSPTIIACAIFIPLLRSYKAGVAGTQFGVTYFQPSWWSAFTFYFGLVSPCVVVVVVMFLLFAIDTLRPPALARSAGLFELGLEELTLACSFLLLPFFGVLAGKLVHGPFIPRYFMSTVIGFCLLVSFMVRAPRTRNRTAILLTAVIVALLARTSLLLVWHRMHGVGEKLYEAGTGMLLETTPGNPLKGYSLLTANMEANNRPVAILWTLDFLYLTYYAPRILPRLYYVSCSSDAESLRAIHVVRQWTRGNYNAERSCGEFVSSNRDFLTFGFLGTDAFKMLQVGATIQSSTVKVRTGRFFARMRGNPEAKRLEKALPQEKPGTDIE